MNALAPEGAAVKCAGCAHFIFHELRGKQGLIGLAGICGMYKSKYQGRCGIKAGSTKDLLFTRAQNDSV
eukprot:scaffold127171_cov19-Tisochrysis_lutea.AAC.1